MTRLTITDSDPSLAVKQAGDRGVLVDSLSNNRTCIHADSDHRYDPKPCRLILHEPPDKLVHSVLQVSRWFSRSQITPPSSFIFLLTAVILLRWTVAVEVGTNVIRLPPVAHLAQPDLDVLDLHGQPVAFGEATDKPGHPAEEAEEEALGGWPSCDALRVLLDAVLAVAGELHRLPDPWRALAVVVVVEGAGLLVQEEQEEGVHHLHLVLDELHVAADAAKQLCLVDEHGADAAQQRLHGALGRADHELRHCRRLVATKLDLLVGFQTLSAWERGSSLYINGESRGFKVC
uniref:Uncharacterized protein n=1 Tax=Oryza nivara TaxID=4536 RepID=A0A0E0J551_ORYNI